MFSYGKIIILFGGVFNTKLNLITNLKMHSNNFIFETLFYFMKVTYLYSKVEANIYFSIIVIIYKPTNINNIIC